MNTINHFEIKDCLALFFIIDEADPNVWSIFAHFTYSVSLILFAPFLTVISKRIQSSPHLLNIFVQSFAHPMVHGTWVVAYMTKLLQFVEYTA